MVFKNLTLLTIALFISSGCGPKSSDPHAMESNDWFKNGVDRFYLAHSSTGKKILDGYEQKHGEKYFFGIGCFGEDKNPDAVTYVKKKKDASDYIQMPLNKRTMLYQFDIIENDQKPTKGQCKILIGDKVSPQQISNGQDLINKSGNYSISSTEVAQKLAAAGLGCFTFIAAATKYVGTVAAGGYATAQTGGAAAPVMIPLILTETASVASAGLFCALWIGWSKDAVRDFKIGENQKLFGTAMNKASNLAIDAMHKDGSLDVYNELAQSEDPREISVAAAIWNTHFVSAFNEGIYDKFENGWGGETKFFDAVGKVKTEYLSKASTFSK
jgi:hypothetical protein